MEPGAGLSTCTIGRLPVVFKTLTMATADVPATPVASVVCAAIQCAPFATLVVSHESAFGAVAATCPENRAVEQESDTAGGGRRRHLHRAGNCRRVQRRRQYDWRRRAEDRAAGAKHLHRRIGDPEQHVGFVVGLVGISEKVVRIDDGPEPVRSIRDAIDRNRLAGIAAIIFVNGADRQSAKRRRVRARPEQVAERTRVRNRRIVDIGIVDAEADLRTDRDGGARATVRRDGVRPKLASGKWK
jgi:hypothetical protein